MFYAEHYLAHYAISYQFMEEREYINFVRYVNGVITSRNTTQNPSGQNQHHLLSLTNDLIVNLFKNCVHD